jgi:uncharacterized membrane protein YfcA
MPLFVTLGLIEYSRSGNVDWYKAMALAIGGVVGATIGARFAGKISGTMLRRLFSLFLMITGAKMTVDAAPIVLGWQSAASMQAHSVVNGGPEALVVMAVVGVATGILSGLLGVGGGILMIPAMVLLLGIPQKMAQGISLAVIIPVSISGTLIHYKKGNVDTNVTLWIGVGGMLGAYLGALLANDLQPSMLRLIFGLFMLIISGLMFSKKE